MPSKRSSPRIPIPFEELSAPAQRALRGAGFKYLDQLALVPEREVAGLHGLGPSTLKILRTHLRRHQLAFARARPR